MELGVGDTTSSHGLESKGIQEPKRLRRPRAKTAQKIKGQNGPEDSPTMNNLEDHRIVII